MEPRRGMESFDKTDNPEGINIESKGIGVIIPG
jgi:hypothetical protein